MTDQKPAPVIECMACDLWSEPHAWHEDGVDHCPALSAMIDQKPAPVVACTLAASDAGDVCRWCGYASGPGHGKAR